MSDVVLSVPVNAGGVDPLLASLEKINENLKEINLSSKGSFDLFAKSIDKSNKKLKETDKTFGDIFKKIKLSGLMKMGAGVIGAGAGLLGISTGAMLFGALRNAAGNIGTSYQAKGLGMSTAEMKALQFASKATTGKEDTLITAITSLTNAMNTAEGQSALTALGMNVAQLQNMNPEDALQAVFEAVRGKGTGTGFEYLQNAFSQVTGLSKQDYAVATKQGASFEAPYNEFLTKFGAVDWAALARGSESMIKFQAGLDIVSSKLGSSLADPLSSVLDKLAPHIDDLANRLAAFLDSITQEDVDNFVKNVEKVFTFIANLAGGIFTSAEDTKKQQEVSARLSTGESKAGDAAAIASVTAQRILNVFSAEGRAKNAQQDFEMRLANFLNEGFSPEEMRKVNKGLYSEAEKKGYIKDGALTEKGQALTITVVVKDPAGNVLSSAIQTQSKPTPYIPTRTASTKKGG